MAWEARSGLKLDSYSISTEEVNRLNGLWSPFGIERLLARGCLFLQTLWLNGLWSPFGIERLTGRYLRNRILHYSGT